jgi:hypothetical protein
MSEGAETPETGIGDARICMARTLKRLSTSQGSKGYSVYSDSRRLYYSTDPEGYYDHAPVECPYSNLVMSSASESWP